MSLQNLITKTTSRTQKRVGRGYGSGKGGHTAGRGTKGQKSRGGVKFGLWFEGGQLPLTKRMPMQRGKGRFNVIKPTAEISLTDLGKMQAKTVTLETLKLEKVIDPRFAKAKVVKTGSLKRKVNVEGLKVTAGARAEIEKSGGKVN